MPNWKKFKFRITGKVHDEELTPLTMPMSRLAEYLKDLSEVLGRKEDVHLVTVDDGSTAPVIYMNAAYQDAILAQVRRAQAGAGPRDANDAWNRINDRLREDDGSADFIDADSNIRVIEFPGKNIANGLEIKPIREHASITGELRRVGGLDKTIHLQLRRADGEVVYVEADEAFAKQLEGRLFSYIRVNGVATWRRDEHGNWMLEKFRAQSYDPEPLINEPFGATINELKSLPGNKWAEVDDPFGELRKIRHGEDEPTQ